MDYIFQNDKRLYPVIQNVGCFFRSALLIAEMHTGMYLTADKINEIWDICKSKTKGYIDDKDNVKLSAPIITLGLQACRAMNSRAIEIGTDRAGIVTYYASIPKELQDPTFSIMKYRQNGPSKTHFVAVHENDIYDPMIHQSLTEEPSIRSSIKLSNKGD